VERARGRDRGAVDEDRPLELGRFGSARDDRVAFDPAEDEPADVEGFPVMVRLGELQGQIGALARRMERFGEVLERLEQAIAGGAFARAARGADEPFPAGVTARANPMTHPVTPPSARTAPDTGRDEALATVRALFTRRRPWWQRLPDLLRG
jgi:hypothetical protein